MKLIKGNCLEEMKKLPDKSVDLLICDLPYTDMNGKGETNCSWNQGVLDLEEFWVQFKRLRKSKRTACIHFCSTRFGYSLIKSWEKGFKMDMVWKKRNKTGGLGSRYRPMRNHEMVYFFYEQAPKYNRDKYHKRINNKKHAKSETTKEKKSDTVIENEIIETPKRKSIKDRKGMGEQAGIYPKENMTFSNFEPPNPSSVIEEAKETDPWGLKNGGDKGRGLKYEPPNPASVINEKYTKEHLDNNRAGAGRKSVKDRKGMITKSDLYPKENQTASSFEPPNPASVIDETDIYGETKTEMRKRGKGHYHAFEPPNPASVIDEDEEKKNNYEIYCEGAWKGVDTTFSNGIGGKLYNPGLPASVIEEDEEKIWGEKKKDRHQRYIECGCGYFEPRQPDSVFESGKVFIGKRNHQTEKPQDILEFFLKYWSDEGDVILDPTMGSGSTGVACKNLNRQFIGIELTEKYYEVAKQRCGVEN